MRRSAKLLTALAVIAASATIVLWNTGAQSAPPALGVADAKREAHEWSGRDVTVRGNVVEGSIREEGSRVVEFVIADAFEKMRVAYNQTPPDSFGAKEVVVRGQLWVAQDGVPFLEARTIQVGCASKY